jgi:hypothetical protein
LLAELLVAPRAVEGEDTNELLAKIDVEELADRDHADGRAGVAVGEEIPSP